MADVQVLRLREEVDNFLAFTGADKPEKGSVFFVVMGMTGSGKSSFISDSTGRSDVVVGHDLASCTSNVEIFKARVGGRMVYILDTPGFDDTNRSDMEILATIAHYFSVSYANHVSINGVIYLHRISDTRVGGSSRRNIEMMKGLVGQESFANVAIVTNMWRADDFLHQEARETQLQKEYFAELLAGDAVMLRHGPHADANERRESARAILQWLLERWGEDPVTLQIQYEMVDERMTLDETTAGRTLKEQMEASQESNEKKIAECKDQLNEIERDASQSASNDESTKELLAQQSDLRRQLEESRRAQEEMKAGIYELHQRERDKLMEQLQAMEASWQNALAEKARQEELKEASFLEQQRQWAEERQRLEDAKQFAETQTMGYPSQLDPRVQQLMLQQQVLAQQEAMYKAELERMQAEVAELRESTQAKTREVARAKAAWGTKKDWMEAAKLGVKVASVTNRVVTGQSFCNNQ